MRRRFSELGFMGLEGQGTLLFYLYMVAGGGLILYMMFSGGKLAEMEQSIAAMRMNTQQMYTSSLDYTGLTNDVAIKSGLASQKLIRGGALLNSWGGAVTIATGTDVTTFTITLAGVPQDACTKLASFQNESWLTVEVNDTAINKDTAVAEAAAACQATNAIVYTSR